MNLVDLNREKKNRKKTPLDMSTMIYGKVPPQARDLEEAVLGAIMLEREGFDQVVEILSPETFYVDAHMRIFRAMQSLANKSQPIDILTVIEELRSRGELDVVGGPYYITKLSEKVVSAANIESHARIIYERYLKREQIRVCGEGITQAYEDATDAFETLEQLEYKVSQLSMKRVQNHGEDIDTSLVKTMRSIEEMRHRPKEQTVIGTPTGFPVLDRFTKGWINTYLIILAARPSVGKTALALNLARNAAADRYKPTAVAFFSLEMNQDVLTKRLLSAESGIPFEKIIEARLSENEMRDLFEKGTVPLSKYPIHLDYCPSLNVMELRAKIRKWKKRYTGKIWSVDGKTRIENFMVIIDYLQLMSGSADDDRKNRDQQLSNITRTLKNLAGELDIPIIALSQMSRDVEKRGSKTPQLSDLRDSGGIEQDADIVAFLDREDYQEIDREVDPMDKDKGFIWFKKHRNGPLERIPMRTALEIQRWMDPDQYHRYKNGLLHFRPVHDRGPDLFISSESRLNDLQEDYF